jgi:hypothetical protein
MKPFPVCSLTRSAPFMLLRKLPIIEGNRMDRSETTPQPPSPWVAPPTVDAYTYASLSADRSCTDANHLKRRAGSNAVRSQFWEERLHTCPQYPFPLPESRGSVYCTRIRPHQRMRNSVLNIQSAAARMYAYISQPTCLDKFSSPLAQLSPPFRQSPHVPCCSNVGRSQLEARNAASLVGS